MRVSHIHLLDYAALEDARPLGARTARRALGALVAALVAWHRAAVERRQLLSFSDRDLRDLALSRVDAATPSPRVRQRLHELIGSSLRYNY